MKKNTKRLSLLLALLMLFSCFSFTAFADTNTCQHSYTVEVVAPGCVSQGYTRHFCPLCGDWYDDTFVDSLGHIYPTDPVVNVPATCFSEGLQEWECTRCKAHLAKTIPVLNHVDNDKNGLCDYCGTDVGRKTVFSPYDWLKAFFEFITNLFQSIVA